MKRKKKTFNVFAGLRTFVGQKNWREKILYFIINDSVWHMNMKWEKRKFLLLPSSFLNLINRFMNWLTILQSIVTINCLDIRHIISKKKKTYLLLYTQANTSRGQSPYPSGVQSPGPYPPNAGQQQTNQPPGPPQQYQYPQRYPTPPANQQPPMGPQNHRPPYSQVNSYTISYVFHNSYMISCFWFILQWPSPAASPGPHLGTSQSSPHAPPQSPGPQQTSQQPPQLAGAPSSPSLQQPQSPHQVIFLSS